MPEFYTITARKIFPVFFFFFWGGGDTYPTAPTDPPFPTPIWVVIGLHDNGFPGPAVALDGQTDSLRYYK